MGKHTVQGGETPQDVSKRHTGHENRYLDLLPANPHLKTVVDGQTGRPNFDNKDWHDGLVVNIPDRWSESGQMHGVKPSGSVGCGGGCGSASDLYQRNGTVGYGPTIAPKYRTHEWERTLNDKNLMGQLLENRNAAGGWGPTIAPEYSSRPRVARGKGTAGPTYTVDSPGHGPTIAGRYRTGLFGAGKKSASGMVSWSKFLNRGIGSPYGYGYLGAGEEDIGKKQPDPEGGETGSGGGPGGTCNLTSMSDVKPYEFLLEDDDTLCGIAQAWLGKSNVWGKELFTCYMLQRANASRLQSDCSHTKGGRMQIRIPKDWPACPDEWAGRRVNPDGTKYTEGEPPGGEVPGGDPNIDRINVTGAGGDSSMIWWLLAGGAAVAGAIVLSKKYKGRK